MLLVKTSRPRSRALLLSIGSLALPLLPALPAFGAVIERTVAFRGVRVESPGSAPIENATLVVRDGVIAAVAPNASIPPDAKVIDGAGLTVVPSFVDTWSTAFSLEPPKKEAQPNKVVDEGAVIGMDHDARYGRTPEARTEFALPFKDARKWRENGFGAFVGVPLGSGIRGQSAIGWLLDDGATVPDVTLARDVFMHVDLSIAAPSYPSTLMGVLAAYRQYLADAERNAAMWRRYDKSGKKVERPVVDLGFNELLAAKAAGKRFVFTANEAREIRVALSLAKEFGVKPAIAGGAEADLVIAELKAADAFVLLGLDFPKKADDDAPAGPGNLGAGEHEEFDERGECDDCTAGIPREPEFFSGQDPAAKPQNPAAAAPEAAKVEGGKPDAKPAEKKNRTDVPAAAMAERDQKRQERIATASKLAAAGVPFAFTAKDLKSPDEFRANLKLAIDAGLARDAALAAATSRAADLVGLQDAFGGVEPGRVAALTFFSGDPLDPATKVRYALVGKERFEFEPPKAAPDKKGKGVETKSSGNDVTGVWAMKVDMGDSAREYQITFDQKEGRLSGTSLSGTGTSGELSSGSVAGDSIEFMIVINPAGRHYEFSYSGKVSGDQMSGTVSINGGEGHPWSATRTSKPQGGAR